MSSSQHKYKIGDIIVNINPAFDGVAKITRITESEYYYVNINSKYNTVTESDWEISECEKNTRKLTKLEHALR